MPDSEWSHLRVCLSGAAGASPGASLRGRGARLRKSLSDAPRLSPRGGVSVSSLRGRRGGGLPRKWEAGPVFHREELEGQEAPSKVSLGRIERKLHPFPPSRCKFFSLTETPEDYTLMVDEEGFKGGAGPGEVLAGCRVGHSELRLGGQRDLAAAGTPPRTGCVPLSKSFPLSELLVSSY